MRWRRKPSREQDLDRELRSHLELEAEELQDSGLDAEEARFAARRALGNITFTKEEVRRMWGWTSWDILIQDFQYALRALRKNPGFAVTAVLTLALGIGASTVVFTVVDSVILKPLSYRDSGSLVIAWERIRFLSGDPTGPNPRHVDVWQKRARTFRGLAFMRNLAMGVTIGAGHPQPTGAVVCLPNLFDVLQVQPHLGRTFSPEDGVRGHDNVAILTYSAWQNLFQADPGVIGKTIRLDDVPREIVGVLPAAFHFPNGNALRPTRSAQQVSGAPDPAVFFPAALDVTQFPWNGNYGNWITIGRLNPGVSVRQAEAELTAVTAQMVREIPANQINHEPGALLPFVQPMQEAVVGNSRTGLWLLMAAVLGLMLMACVNLANAQLGRVLSRRREAAVRIALGAAKWRLVWSALAENLLVVAAGGGGGILLASVGLNLFRRYSPVDLPRLSEVHLNLTVLLFSVSLTFAASPLSGMLPVLRLLATDPQTSLQQGNGRAMGSRQSSRFRAWLIGLQVFGSTLLLLVTGLFSKSLLHLLRQDMGFETGRVAIADVRLTFKTYGADMTRIAFDDAVLENLRAIPGVQRAGLVSAMPLEGESWIEFAQRPDRPNLEGPLINLRWASLGYFEATGQTLVAGRFFEEQDRNLNSAILSESEAKALWGNENPIGGQVKLRGRARTVVGVVADSRSTSLKTAPVRLAYLHYKDQPPYSTFFVVRSAQAPEALIPAIRSAIWKRSPEVNVARVKTLDAQLADSLATERFETSTLMAFGIGALLLAMLGIYGLLSYSVTTRRQEIGVRMALGASRKSVYLLTFAAVGTPVAAGLAFGLIGSIAAGRLTQKLLYGVQVLDPAVILIVTGLFLLAAAAAAFLPARRAASVDPMEVLRSD